MVAAECASGREAVQAIRTQGVDLVFLDVQMPDLDGFGVITEVGSSRMPPVVFVTAFDRHALKAFEVHALDYLLKPFDRRRFREAVRRAVRLIGAAGAGDQAGRLETLLRELKPPRPWLDRVLVRSHGRMRFIRLDSVDWIQAEGNYLRLHIGDQGHLLRQTMKELERQLDPARFLRIHRSTIVNLDQVKEIQPLFSGEHSVVLRDGTELTLSKGFRDRLERFLARRG